MRESKFILQNKEKWHKYEEGLRKKTLAAEEMEHAFVELNDDLAYARTFYKNRAVRLFLNNLLAPVYTKLYTVKKWNLKALGEFFSYDAPLMNFQARKFMLIAFLIVITGFAIGYLSTGTNLDFAALILGEDYIRMTELNISKGDPLAVYKYGSPGEMFSYIALNNLKVALYFFLFGALFCVGSMYLLLSNGIMLGAFTYLFTSKGLTTEYLLTVYQHGTLEMLSMIVEGAAGIMMGAGFLFPGTKSRLRSIQDSAKKSILMFLVCIPVIIIAAFIESYLTRFTELPDLLRIFIILLSLLFMAGYFIIYPYVKFRKSRIILGKYDTLNSEIKIEPKPGILYSTGKITLSAFGFLKNKAGTVLLIALVAFGLLYPLNNWITDNLIEEDIRYEQRYFLTQSEQFLKSGEASSGLASSSWRMVLFNYYSTRYIFSGHFHTGIMLTSFLLIFTLLVLVVYSQKGFIEAYRNQKLKNRSIIYISLFCSVIQVICNTITGNSWWLSMLLLLPVQMYIISAYLMIPGRNIWSAFISGISNALNGLGKFLSALLISVVLYFILMTGIMWFMIIIIGESGPMHGSSVISESILFFYARFNYFLIPFFMGVILYIYFQSAAVVIESRTGAFLKKTIAEIGFRKEVYGIETE